MSLGIDLGTSNSALAWAGSVGSHAASRTTTPAGLQLLDIPQLVAPGQVDLRPLLPSSCYLPAANELADGAAGLPWTRTPPHVVGEAARGLGAARPERLVGSAKSWLSHDTVDRRAAILPWGAPNEVERISPVTAQAMVLDHLRAAWNHTIASGDSMLRLEHQEVVLCVPASFDETARELTVEAARTALKMDEQRLVLLEEPLAAMYAWLAARDERWSRRLKAGERVLVCDVGGGTTDLSLVAVCKAAGGGLELERTAVSDHLLLGGDNMDLALTRIAEERLAGSGGKHLEAAQWQELLNSCRLAKESLLRRDATNDATVSVRGRGRKLVGATRRTTLGRQEVRDLILDGFFPLVDPDQEPRRGGRVGLTEFGLPYATDPAITRHLAGFLRRHAEDGDPRDRAAGGVAMARPAAVLFNGGPFRITALRERILAALCRWFEPNCPGYKPRVLRGESPDLAVALGAAWFGQVRRGSGTRIRGGLARSYYAGVETSDVTGCSALCLVPHGLEEGAETEIDRDLHLRTNRAVSFGLFASSSRPMDRPGDLVDVSSQEFIPLPPLATVVKTGRKAARKQVPVYLQAKLTEVGTLEISLAERGGDRRWQLAFGVRHGNEAGAEAATEAEDQAPAAPGTGAPPALEAGDSHDPQALGLAADSIRAAFESSGPGGSKALASLMRQLEDDLGCKRDSWSLAAIRYLWDHVAAVAERRKVTRDHEARWLNLAGFCLRPGTGASADPQRIKDVWKVALDGISHPRHTPSRVEWQVLWRRLAGGLGSGQQEQLIAQVMGKLDGSKGPRLGGQEREEAWRLAASLEHVSTKRKRKLGNLLLDLLGGDDAPRVALWAVGRLGARAPIHAPANAALPADQAGQWLERLLDTPPPAPVDALAFCLVQLGRLTGDRARDVAEDLRRRAATVLRDLGASGLVVRHLEEITAYQANEQRILLADSLPPGLRLEA